MCLYRDGVPDKIDVGAEVIKLIMKDIGTDSPMDDLGVSNGSNALYQKIIKEQIFIAHNV